MCYGEQTIEGKKYAFAINSGAMIVDSVYNGQYYGLDGMQREKYTIEGKTNTTVEQMVRFYNKKKGSRQYPTNIYKEKGAESIEEFAKIFYEECEKEGIKPEVAWAQTMLETGYLGFGGQVKVEQCNFAGLGAIDGGAAGATFDDVRTGIRAQVQHLKAYANANITSDTLATSCVDPRFNLVNPKGSSPYVEWLGQKENPDGKGWATSEKYGIRIRKLMQEIWES